MPLKRSYCDNIVYNNGLNNMPSGHSEIKTCPNCGTEIIRKNITGDIEVELVEEE